MKLTIISDVWALTNNGTSNTYNTLAREMVKRGHAVKIVAPCPKDCIDEYGIEWISVPARNFYCFNKYIRKNGIILSRPIEQKILKGIIGADCVHLLLPFKMARKTIPLLNMLNIPYTTACHAQAENVSAHLKMENGFILNNYVYNRFYRTFYQYTHFAHAPSELMKSELQKHKCTNIDFRVITNGVREVFTYNNQPKPDEYKDKFVILNSGRYSNEKNQGLLLKAVARSKYKDNIKVVLAGAGPKEKYYKKLARKLGVDTRFGYFQHDELIQVYQSADLYVHPGVIELEGISCLEAMATGRPCIFSDSKKAAMRFYGHPDSLFKSNDVDVLTKKIDYYYEHADERLALGEWYAKNSEQFKLSTAMDQMEIMFNDAIAYYRDYYHKFPDGGVHGDFEKSAKDHVVKAGNSGKRKRVDGNFNFNNKNIFFRMWSAVILFLAKAFIPIIVKCNGGYKIFNRRKAMRQYKNKGAVIICNHVKVWDGPLICSKAVGWRRKVRFIMLGDSLSIPVAGKLLMALGGHPTADDIAGARNGFRVLDEALQNKKLVLLFPEASLHPDSTELREFSDGAFRIAYKNKVSICPMVITFKQKLKKDGSIKSKMYLTICAPIEANYDLDKKASVLDLINRSKEVMQKTAEEFYKKYPLVAQVYYRMDEKGEEQKIVDFISTNSK